MHSKFNNFCEILEEIEHNLDKRLDLENDAAHYRYLQQKAKTNLKKTGNWSKDFNENAKRLDEISKEIEIVNKKIHNLELAATRQVKEDSLFKDAAREMLDIENFDEIEAKAAEILRLKRAKVNKVKV